MIPSSPELRLTKMLRVGTKKNVNKLRDMAISHPKALLTETKESVKVTIDSKLLLSALKMRGGWSIVLRDVVIDDQIISWSDPID
jgi:hypothetical protein